MLGRVAVIGGSEKYALFHLCDREGGKKDSITDPPDQLHRCTLFLCHGICPTRYVN